MQNSFTNVNSYKCICGIYNSLKLFKKWPFYSISLKNLLIGNGSNVILVWTQNNLQFG